MGSVKKEIRVIGIDDGPFDKFKDKNALLVGTLYRGGNFMDGLLSTSIKIDGTDSTNKIAQMVNKSKFHSQIRCIFLNGITVGGFNVIDLHKLREKTGKWVIAITRQYPDFKKIFKALDKLGYKRQKKIIESLPEPVKVGKVYMQYIGITEKKAKEIVKICTTYAEIPEALRLAHIIAGGIVTGESTGGA